MNKHSNDEVAGAIWGSIRSLISWEYRHEAARAILTELPLDDDVPYLIKTKLLLADAGELDDEPYRDACDECGSQAVWQGTNNEYVGDSHLACNNCVTKLGEPKPIT